MRRLVCEYYDGFSFGNFVRRYPDLQGTVTDILIGDLFTDRVDKVWAPMESLYPPGKGPIPTWDAGTPADKADDKVNELMLPEGRRPPNLKSEDDEAAREIDSPIGYFGFRI